MARSSAARKSAEPIEIPLLNGIPVRARDQVEWVCRAVRGLRNERGEVIGIGRITAIVKALGLPDRGPGGSPSKQYLLVRSILNRARDQGLVQCEDLRWEAAS
jgi:hypothetical protein